ncbi:MAG: hypothetical protein ABJA79_06800 [Parafilimonas sp.]
MLLYFFCDNFFEWHLLMTDTSGNMAAGDEFAADKIYTLNKPKEHLIEIAAE